MQVWHDLQAHTEHTPACRACGHTHPTHAHTRDPPGWKASPPPPVPPPLLPCPCPRMRLRYAPCGVEPDLFSRRGKLNPGPTGCSVMPGGETQCYPWDLPESHCHAHSRSLCHCLGRR